MARRATISEPTTPPTTTLMRMPVVTPRFASPLESLRSFGVQVFAK
jgi:hypothetical protein